MINKIFLFILFIAFWSPGFLAGQEIQFLTIHADGYEPNDKGEYFFDEADIAFHKEAIGLYSKKKDLLIEYFRKLYEHDKKGAKELLKKDSLFTGVSKNEIHLMTIFEYGRMNELGLLYKPRVISYEGEKGSFTNAFICTVEQLEEMKGKNLFQEHTQILVQCRYIGELVPFFMKVYELVGYEN